MKEFKTVIGKHDFKPWDTSIWPILSYKDKKFTWTIKFDPSCVYDLKSDDQKDWNKGGGISHYASANNENTIFWVWRYDLKAERIELGLYINDSEGAHTFKTLGFIEFNTEYQIDLSFPINVILMELKFPKENYILSYAEYTHEELLEMPKFKALKLLRANIMKKAGLYFGGDIVAPKVMSIFVKYKKTKNKQ